METVGIVLWWEGIVGEGSGLCSAYIYDGMC